MGGTYQKLRAKRDKLAPVYTGAGVALAGEAAQLPLDFLTTTTVGASLGACALAVGSYIQSQTMDKVDRAYRYLVLGASTSYVMTVHELGHTWWQVPALIGGAGLLGIPWWKDQHKTNQVRMEGVVERWPSVSARLSMSETRMVDVRVSPNGNHHGRIVWPAGAHTVRSVLARKEEIEGALDLPAGSLRLERNGRDSNSVNYHAVLADPHAEAVEYQIPTEERDGELYLREVSVMDEMSLGVRENGTWRRLRWFVEGWGARQALVGGAKGSGKSGLLNLLVAAMACAHDAVLWGIDLKGGMELGPWRKVCDWMVRDYLSALRMIEALEAIVDERAVMCEEMVWRFWKPSREFPVLVVVVDECHSLNGSMRASELAMLERVCQKARAVGVIIVEATQYPVMESVGSNLVRQQMDQRFCFRMMDGAGERVVFGEKVSVDADMIPASRPGTCFHQDNEELDRMPLRVQWVSDETRDEIVRLRAGYTTGLDERSALAAERAVPEYADRPVPVPVDEDGSPVPFPRSGETSETSGTGVTETEIPEWNDGPDVPLGEILRARDESLSPEQRERESRERAEVEREALERESRGKLGEREALEALGAALRAAGTEGIRAKDLQAAATRGSTWLYDTGLPYFQERGQAWRTSRGMWTATPPLVNSHSE